MLVIHTLEIGEGVDTPAFRDKIKTMCIGCLIWTCACEENMHSHSPAESVTFFKIFRFIYFILWHCSF